MLCGVAVAMINNACDFCRQKSIIRFAAKYYVFPAFGFFFFLPSVKNYCHLLSKHSCVRRETFLLELQSLAERGSASHLYSSRIVLGRTGQRTLSFRPCNSVSCFYTFIL